jgi:hypothetical protein
VDPEGTDDIEMTTSSAGSLPNPNLTISKGVSPGATLPIPAAGIFTNPPDDLEVGHVVAWHGGANQSASMTPPSGWTERSDESDQVADQQISMHTSVATRRPATGTSANFTSSQSNWQLNTGMHVVVRGGNGTSPQFRSVSHQVSTTIGSSITTSMSTPSGVVAGDALLAFVTVGTRNGFVPTGWQTPQGWIFLGADFTTSTFGGLQHTLATGVWVRRAVSGEPSTHSTTIQLPGGRKLIKASMVAVQAPFTHPGGPQVRIAGRPIRRLLAFNELTAVSAILCDFQNISQGYDNLEVVIDGQANADVASGQVLRMRFNNDNGSNYYDLRTFNGMAETARFASTGGVLVGRIPNTAGARVVGSNHVYGYASNARPGLLGNTYTSQGLTIRNEVMVGQWDATGPINRVQVRGDNDAGTAARFAVGSRAYLYGY